MDLTVNKAFEAGIQAYAKSEGNDAAGFSDALRNVFDQQTPFLEKVEGLDRVFDDHQRFEELREIYFDLLMVNFFSEDVQTLDEDYLESEEWESIEEQTIERGTELLNVFLYLRECADDEIEPSLDDYLKEFLLVEEDEFQDEYNIYEKIIANQILVDSTYGEIRKVAEGISHQDELKELFYPLMSFFNETKPSARQLEEYADVSANKSFDLAVYQVIVNFNS